MCAIGNVVTRWLSALLFALTLAQGTGIAAFALPDECVENCPDERSDGDCPPACNLCTCCAATRPVLLVRAAVPTRPGPGARVRVESLAAWQAPDPREILHVPELLA